MRNYGFAPQRNSRTADWIAFADRCHKARFVPIFVPHTEVAIAMEPADLGVIACLAACWNLEMALYETAWLDVSVMHGPLELCSLNENARYFIFIPVGADANNSMQALNRARPSRWRRSRLRNALSAHRVEARRTCPHRGHILKLQPNSARETARVSDYPGRPGLRHFLR
jgi:hypothetical protein